MILSDLAKYPMTRSVSRSVCESWVPCCVYSVTARWFCQVSFNSAMPRAQSFIISYCGFRLTTAYNIFCSADFGVLRLSLLVINTSSTVPAINKRRRLPAMSATKLPRSGKAVCITLGGRLLTTRDEDKYRSIIAFFAHTFLHSKTPSCSGLPIGILP